MINTVGWSAVYKIKNSELPSFFVEKKEDYIGSKKLYKSDHNSPRDMIC